MGTSYSLTLSRVLTALQMVTLANEGMFGSCEISSSVLIVFAALTPRPSELSWSIITESLTIFLIFLGVVGLSETDISVPMAL